MHHSPRFQATRRIHRGRRSVSGARGSSAELPCSAEPRPPRLGSSVGRAIPLPWKSTKREGAGLEPVQKADNGSDQAAALAGQFTGRTADRPRCPDAYRQGQGAPIGPHSYGSGAGGVHRVLTGGEGRPMPPLAAKKPRAFGPS